MNHFKSLYAAMMSNDERTFEPRLYIQIKQASFDSQWTKVPKDALVLEVSEKAIEFESEKFAFDEEGIIMLNKQLKGTVNRYRDHERKFPPSDLKVVAIVDSKVTDKKIRSISEQIPSGIELYEGGAVVLPDREKLSKDFNTRLHAFQRKHPTIDPSEDSTFVAVAFGSHIDVVQDEERSSHVENVGHVLDMFDRALARIQCDGVEFEALKLYFEKAMLLEDTVIRMRPLHRYR